MHMKMEQFTVVVMQAGSVSGSVHRASEFLIRLRQWDRENDFESTCFEAEFINFLISQKLQLNLDLEAIYIKVTTTCITVSLLHIYVEAQGQYKLTW